ncbi:hypothetical protein GS982_01615 [Rhodococcus hoagii]|uniref:Band 7 domain-containing protein n=1 Tax=Rhodococcus hoagii TaxID=43767 RepID=A0A9Q5EW66_RHOHA|nr:hypothetical protein [Prescottella equi]MBM4708668.1 hypothetical protein [Prescottella equi]NKT77295.1 hypothetical protein [Prescottella equi]NKZ81082.1 hypothetical protein [Prescottella equi]
MNIKRALGASMIAAAALVGTTACTVTAPAPDEAGIVYNAGPVAKTEFQNCVAPGGRSISDPFDKNYTYPAGQRTYVFGNGEERDMETITVADKDGIDLGVQGQLRFALNTECDTLVQFHEKIGLKAGGDWKGILAIYLQQPLRKAITEATQGMTWRELYQDPAKKAEWEKRVKDALPGAIKQATGDEYFTGIDISLQKPILPAALTQQLQATQTATEAKNAQIQENLRLTEKAKGEQAQIDLLKSLGEQGAQNYVTLKAIESGKIQILPVPQGSIINMPAR